MIKNPGRKPGRKPGKTPGRQAVQKIDFDHLAGVQIALLFHKTPKTVSDWANARCPRNPDGSFCAVDVYNWLMEREKEKNIPNGTEGLKDKKLEREIKIKELQIQKMEQESISRVTHNQICASRAASLRAFLEDTALLNAHHYLGKNLDQIRVIRIQESKEMMDAYLGGKVIEDESTDIEEVKETE